MWIPNGLTISNPFSFQISELEKFALEKIKKNKFGITLKFYFFFTIRVFENYCFPKMGAKYFSMLTFLVIILMASL